MSPSLPALMCIRVKAYSSTVDTYLSGMLLDTELYAWPEIYRAVASGKTDAYVIFFCSCVRGGAICVCVLWLYLQELHRLASL